MSRRSAILLTKTAFDIPRDGGTLRVAAVAHQLSEQLGVEVHSVAVEEITSRTRRDHRVSILRILWANLRVLGRFARMGSISSVRWYRPRVVREIVEIQEGTNPELRLIEYSQLLGYRPIFAGPVVLDMHNIEAELMRNFASSAVGPKSWVARYEAWRLRALEKSVGERADLVVVVSDHDRDELQSLVGSSAPLPVVVAPNGVGDAGFELDAERADEVVFVAHLGWAPNVAAALWLVVRPRTVPPIQ